MDNVKARLDQALMCNRNNLNLVEKPNDRWEKPRALFCLTRAKKGCYAMVYGHKVSEWLCSKLEVRSEPRAIESTWIEES
jgi:hypothetical protein